MKCIPNLAGVQDCDKTILKELKRAEIMPICVGKRVYTEVPSNLIGYLNGFIFKRAWSYWIVEGCMPIKQAEELYEEHEELQIRVYGHAGDPHPSDWTKEIDGKEYIPVYHIDTQEGLNKFVEKIKSDNINNEELMIRLTNEKYGE